MQATSQNQLAAYYMGIPVKLIFSLIWAISAGVAAIAGILLAPVTLIDINMGLQSALKAFAAAVLGGFGSIPGALVGGIIIGLIELYAGATLPDGFKDIARLHRAADHARRAAAGPVRHASAARRSERRHALRVQDVLRPGHPPVPRQGRSASGTWLLAVAVLVLPAAAARLLCRRRSPGCSSTAIGGVSLMVLVGYTGLVSLGHAAFLGIGAYAHVYFRRTSACPGSSPWRWPCADRPRPRRRRRPAGAAHDRHLPRPSPRWPSR